MSECLHNVRVAYTKGVKAQRNSSTSRTGTKVQCPYGWSKRELESWWNAGYYDSSKNSIDNTFMINDKEIEDGITD